MKINNSNHVEKCQIRRVYGDGVWSVEENRKHTERIDDGH